MEAHWVDHIGYSHLYNSAISYQSIAVVEAFNGVWCGRFPEAASGMYRGAPAVVADSKEEAKAMVEATLTLLGVP